MLLRISRRESMRRKLPGGLKSDSRQPKLSTNSCPFQPWFKSAHQFLRRCSEHRLAPHFLVKERNQSTNRTIKLLPDGLHVLFLHLPQQQSHHDEENHPQTVRHGGQAVAFVANRHHNRAIIAHPVHERDTANQPDHCWEPATERCRDDGSDKRSGGGDGFEVITEKNVAMGRHEIKAFYIERG